jgi:hypothetical protein
LCFFENRFFRGQVPREDVLQAYSLAQQELEVRCSAFAFPDVVQRVSGLQVRQA